MDRARADAAPPGPRGCSPPLIRGSSAGRGTVRIRTMFHVKRPRTSSLARAGRHRPGTRDSVFIDPHDCPFPGEMGYFWPRQLSPVVAVANTVLPTVGSSAEDRPP